MNQRELALAIGRLKGLIQVNLMMKVLSGVVLREAKRDGHISDVVAGLQNVNDLSTAVFIQLADRFESLMWSRKSLPDAIEVLLSERWLDRIADLTDMQTGLYGEDRGE